MSDALAITGLCKNFGALAVSSNISLTLKVGARTALIGPNGAGKTTLINMITGALDPSSGSIAYFGKDITKVPQAQRARDGLLRTFQVTRVFRPLTVADNIRLAVIQQRGFAMRFFLDVARDPDINQQVGEALAMLELEPLADRRIEELAYGERRLVELALALAGKPKVLLLDEPAAGVPKSESSIIMRAITRLPADLAILFIEHDMDLVFRFASEIVVLVAGEIMMVGTPAEVSADERVKEIYFESATMPLRELVLDNVSAGYAGATVLEGVSLSVKRGERVGIVGRNGAGKTTTLASVMGFAELRGGTVKADGSDMAGMRPYRRARLGIGYVPQTRDIFPTLSVEENLEAGLNGRSKQHLAEAFELFPRLAERRRNSGRDLSGGEQQMLSMARALMNDVSILLLDEPLEGLAPIIADELMEAIKRLTQDRGLGCVLIEQHVDTVLDFCDHISVLERGRSVFWGSVAQLRAQPDILNSAIGLHRTEAQSAS